MNVSELNARQKELNKIMRDNAITMDTMRKGARIKFHDDLETVDAYLDTSLTYQRARADYIEARVEYNNNLFREQRRKVNEDFDRLWAEFQHFTVDHKRYQLATKELEAEISRLKYQRGKVFG